MRLFSYSRLGALSFVLVYLFGTIGVAWAKSQLIYTRISPGDTVIGQLKNSEIEPLIQLKGIHSNPIYTANHQKILFSSEDDGPAQLYIMDLSTKKIQKIFRQNTFMDAPALSPDGQILYFVSTKDGTANIYKISLIDEPFPLDLSKATNLTANASGSFRPAVSPDGQSIVFSSNRNRPWLKGGNTSSQNYLSTQLYLMDTQGRNLRQLTDNAHWNGSPVWTPDGQRIIYYATPEGYPRIYSYDIHTQSITALSPKKIPSLSPQITHHNRIVFKAYIDNRWQLASVNLEGADYTVETHFPFKLISAHYSKSNPDPLIVYIPETSEPRPFKHTVELPGVPQPVELMGTSGLFPILDAQKASMYALENDNAIVEYSLDGTYKRTIFSLEQSHGKLFGLSKSPDSEWFLSSVGEPFADNNVNVDIWKIHRSGQPVINLSKGSKANNGLAQFSPQGDKIVFRSTRMGNKNLFIMNSDGSEVKRLTESSFIDTMPSFSMNGQHIVFASMRNGENFNLYRLSLEDSDTVPKAIQVTHHPSPDTHPIFSPDGQWVIYTSGQFGLNDESPLNPMDSAQPYGELVAFRLSDQKTIRLTNSKWESALAYWDPHAS